MFRRSSLHSMQIPWSVCLGLRTGNSRWGSNLANPSSIALVWPCLRLLVCKTSNASQNTNAIPLLVSCCIFCHLWWVLPTVWLWNVVAGQSINQSYMWTQEFILFFKISSKQLLEWPKRCCFWSTVSKRNIHFENKFLRTFSHEQIKPICNFVISKLSATYCNCTLGFAKTIWFFSSILKYSTTVFL